MKKTIKLMEGAVKVSSKDSYNFHAFPSSRLYIIHFRCLSASLYTFLFLYRRFCAGPGNFLNWIVKKSMQQNATDTKTVTHKNNIWSFFNFPFFLLCCCVRNRDNTPNIHTRIWEIRKRRVLYFLFCVFMYSIVVGIFPIFRWFSSRLFTVVFP